MRRQNRTRALWWWVLVAFVAAVACGQGAAWAQAAPSLRASDVLELSKRFEGFSEKLPEASRLGLSEITAFEEHELFVYAEGPLAKAKAAGRRRVVFLKPSTFVVDDRMGPPTAGQAVVWRLLSRAAAEIDGGQCRVVEGDRRVTLRTLLPKGGSWRAAGKGGEGDQAAFVTEMPAGGGQAGPRFVHVAYDGDAPRAKLEARDGVLHLEVAAGGRTLRLTLPAGDDESATIAIDAADGKELLGPQPLAGGILPHGAAGVQMIARWDRAYQGGRRPGWDTGRPSSELVKAVEAGTLKPCRTVVLGCGTGTNAVYLAGKGFGVTALDVAPTALALGEAKARKAGVRVRWVLADVLNPPELGTFGFVFDRGCYHGVRRVSASGYVKTLRGLSAEGTRVLILAGNANQTGGGGPPRVTEAELRGDFSKDFTFESLRESHFDTRQPGGKGALSWFVLLRRKADSGKQGG